MIKLTENNTKGNIASFLKSYKELDMAYGGKEDFVTWFKEFRAKFDSDKRLLAIDIETARLYPVNNKMTMFAVTWKENDIYYSRAFSCEGLGKEDIVKILRALNTLKSKFIYHNAYFDVTTLAIIYGVKLKWDYDTYIMYHSAMTHRAKDKENNDFGQTNTGLSLKDLTRDFLKFGDYESELHTFKKDYCKEHGIKIKEFMWDSIPKDVLAPYNCMDTTCTYQLFEVALNMIKMLENGGYVKLRKLMRDKHEVTDIYMDARIRGIKIDRAKVLELNEYYKEEMDKAYEALLVDLKEPIEKLQRELYLCALESELMKDFEYIAENVPKITKSGKQTWVKKQVTITDKKLQKIKEECKLNLNSSKQKVMLFCDIMGLEPLEKTKGGAPKCDIKFIDHYGETRSELKNLIIYGKCRTALNNFLGVNKVDEEDEEQEMSNEAKTLWELTSDENPYVYPNYNLNGTVTGRCSCSTPNLQQYPSKGVLKKIKECISSRNEHYVLYSDFASAEVALLGSVIDSKVILKALTNEFDLHSMNSWAMLKNDILKVHPDWEKKFEDCCDDTEKLRDFYAGIKAEFEQTIRFKTKSLVFSLAYGTTAHGVSKNLGISKKEAQSLIDAYLKANPEMEKYIKYQHTKAKKYGFTENSFGARLLLPDCPNMYTTDDRHVKMRAEKQLKKSLNYSIQSANAVVLYDGLIRAKKYIKEAGLEGKIHFLASVYDSFMYEVHESVPKEVALDILERAFICYLGDYYLGIDTEIGENWGTVQSIHRERRKKEEIHNYDMKIY